MNPLIDALQTLKLSGGIFLNCDFSAPWCVSGDPVGPAEVGLVGMPLPRHVIAYHYVIRGALAVQTGGGGPVDVAGGELIILPRNTDYRLGSDLGLPPVDAKTLVRPPEADRLASIEYGGGGAPTHILCGFLGTDMPDHPLVAMLPDILTLPVGAGTEGAWIESSLRFAAAEVLAGRAGAPAILAQLAECLFIEAVRRHLESATGQRTGLAEAMRDPLICRVLGLAHGDLARPWTVEDLAAAAGLSRSAFAERFARVMGVPPMRYLTCQRLRLAAERLRTSHEPVARIAFETGYESEAAFHRAFKREMGAPPAAWRARAAG